MSDYTKTYSLSTDFNNNLSLRNLFSEIRDCELGTLPEALKNIDLDGDVVHIIFSRVLTNQEEMCLANIIDQWDNPTGQFLNLGKIDQNTNWGIVSKTVNNGVTKFSGLYYDQQGDDFVFFKNVDKEPIQRLDVKTASKQSALGNVIVRGLDTTSVVMEDSLIQFANNNQGDDIDIGFFGEYVDPETSEKRYAGFYRDYTDKLWKVVDKKVTKPEENIVGDGYQLADMLANNLSLDGNLGVSGSAVIDGDVFVTGTINAEATAIEVSSTLFTLYKRKFTRIFRDKLYGVKNFGIINEIENGPSGFFNVSKSCDDIDGHIVKLSGITDYTGGLNVKWDKFNDIELQKLEDGLFDGDYLRLDNYEPNDAPDSIKNNLQEDIVLTGVTHTTLTSSTTKGNYILHIENDLCGPMATFFLTKNIASGGASISKTTSSPSADNNNLEIKWEANEQIKIRKTKESYNGTYNVILVHRRFDLEKTINLNEKILIDDLIPNIERIATMVSVENVDTDGPSGIYAITKNHTTNKFHVTTIVSTYSGLGWDNLEIIGFDPPSINDVPTTMLVVNPFEIVGVVKPLQLAKYPRAEIIKLVWDEDDGMLRIGKTDPFKGNEVFDGNYVIRIYDYKV